MKASNRLIGVAILFFVLAFALSAVVWDEVSLAPMIGLFVLGFGSGVSVGTWRSSRDT